MCWSELGSNISLWGDSCPSYKYFVSDCIENEIHYTTPPKKKLDGLVET